MKVEAAKSGFKPVTITLESQDELDLLCLVAYHLGGGATASVFGSTGALYDALVEAGGTEDSKFELSAQGHSFHVSFLEEN